MNSNISLSVNNSSSIEEISPLFDYATRVVCLVTHAVYLLVLIFNKELHEQSMIQKHHTNLIGLFIGVIYCAWIGSNSPNTGNQTMDAIVCAMSETLWPISKYARAYSLLILAIYRLIAVFRLNTFKKMIKSRMLSVFSILVVWLVSGLVFIVSKFSTNTQPHPIIMCTDGFSPNAQNSINYFVITSIFGYMLPIVFIIVIYTIIQQKLNRIDQRLHQQLAVKTKKVAPKDVAIVASSRSIYEAAGSNRIQVEQLHQNDIAKTRTTKILY
jgi:hypothetical protein